MSVAKGSIRAWAMAIRPRTLAAGAIPVAVGTAVVAREGEVRAGPALAALAGALLLQIGSNLANDYYDCVRGADTADRKGPLRVTQAGLIPPAAVRRGYRVAFGLAFLVGIYLVAVGGWPIVAIGLAGILCGWAYTGGPAPLGYVGLGDVLVFAFFGPAAVVGTAYVQTGEASQLAWRASVPIGLLATAILAVNNLRDLDTDRACGKRTLAVRLGRRFSRVYYVLLVLGAFAAAVPAGGARAAGAFVVALPLAVAPTWAVLSTVDGPALNRALAQTAVLLVGYGALLAALHVLHSSGCTWWFWSPWE